MGTAPHWELPNSVVNIVPSILKVLMLRFPCRKIVYPTTKQPICSLNTFVECTRNKSKTSLTFVQK